MADWGLVLAGGGGKGSYQMGVWKFLCERGYSKMFRAFSGTSVGALNAALFAQGDPEKAEQVWRNVTTALILLPKQLDTLLSSFQDDPTKAVLSFLENATAQLTLQSLVPHVSIPSFTTLRSFDLKEQLEKHLLQGVFSREGLTRIIDGNIDFSQLATLSVPCYAACCNCTEMPFVEDYIDLSRLASQPEITACLLASSALPAVWPAQQVNGRTYYDGGLLDNVPLQPLYMNTGIRNFLVIHLDPKRQLDEGSFPGCNIVQLNPSKSLGNFFTGTLRFNPKAAAKNIDLGYADMDAALSRIL